MFLIIENPKKFLKRATRDAYGGRLRRTPIQRTPTADAYGTMLDTSDEFVLCAFLYHHFAGS